jgi:putative ATP-binding cassette transporter
VDAATPRFPPANAGAIGVNRISAFNRTPDIWPTTATRLSFGFVQSSILLVSFVGVLWSLSAGFSFHWNGQSIAIPGYMVWAAFLYAGSASLVSWLVARPLVELNSDRYARADLRFSMVRVNEHVDAIALLRRRKR